MPGRWWVWSAMILCLLATLGCGALRTGLSRPRTVTILYTGGLSGRVSAVDGSGLTLSDVAAPLRACRIQAAEHQDEAILLDVGGTLTGVAPLNAWRGGLPMAGAMKELAYDAVLPSERDIWMGKDHLTRLQEAGGFRFLLGNAGEEAFRGPLIRTCGSFRVAVHGIYAPPHVWTREEDAPPPEIPLDRNLTSLRESLARTPADLQIVVARVRDVESLLAQLPPATLIIPACASPTVADHPRLAPALDRPRQIGRITVTVPGNGEEPAISFARDPVGGGITDGSVESAVKAARSDFDRTFEGKYRAWAQNVVAYAEPQQVLDETGSAIADLVADELAADVCVLAPGEARAVKGGVLSEAGLARLVDPGAHVRLTWARGADVETWLQKDGAALAVSGIAAWRGPDGQLVLALHEGRRLSDCNRLRVAVSTRLGQAPSDGAGLTLIEVVRTALHSRPYIAAAPQRWFEATDAAVPDAGALLERGAQLLAERPGEANELWLQALNRKPDEATAKALEAAMHISTPERFPSYVRLAELEERAAQWELAYSTLQMGRLAYPDASTYPLAQARLLITHGLPLDAAPLLDEASKLDAPPADVALLRALQRLMLGDNAGADRLLSNAMEDVDPSQRSKFRALTGLARIRRGDLRGAMAVWSQAPALFKPKGGVSSSSRLSLRLSRREGVVP